MTGHHDNDEMLQRLRRTLDDSVDNLDELTRARLQAARKRAVAEAASRPGWLDWLHAGPIVALPVGVMAVVLVTVLSLQVLRTPPVTIAADAEVLEILATVDELDVLQDMEFYEWLENHEATAS